MNRTAIEWTDFSANPLKFRDEFARPVWGCVKTSPGCANCYAEALAHRWDRGSQFVQRAMDKLTPFLDEQELRRMLTARRIDKKTVAGSRVFVGDMTDIFGEWVSDALLDKLFAVMAIRSDVTWQVLTKRADRMRAYFDVDETDLLYRWSDAAGTLLDGDWIHGGAGKRCRPQIETFIGRCYGLEESDDPAEEGEMLSTDPIELPLPNVWLGVSTEDQQRADERIPHLLQTPATVRFISAEPLLGPIDLTRVRESKDYVVTFNSLRGTRNSEWGPQIPMAAKVDWVIPGGESGARPCDIEWIRSLVLQCGAAGVACFVKQLGSVPFEYVGPNPHTGWRGDLRAFRNSDAVLEAISLSQGRIPNTIANKEIKDRKGGDPSEWPEDLRVREFPRSAVPA